jgi:hypothetical protein
MTQTDIGTTSWEAAVTLPVGLAGDGERDDLREVTLRKMTGNEEAILVDPRLRRNGGKLITALLASCTRVDGRPLPASAVRRLASADRNFLLLELRRLTFGDLMEARYTCPRCGAATRMIEDLAELPVRVLPEGADTEIEVSLVDGYRDHEGGVQRDLVFGLPTGEDEEIASAGREDNPARQRDALMTRCLRRVGELDPRRMRAIGTRVLSDLSITDRRLVQKALDDGAPGPDLVRTVTCDACGEEFRATLDMSHFFALE